MEILFLPFSHPLVFKDDFVPCVYFSLIAVSMGPSIGSLVA